ncbi:hypothetical protein [Sphingomonas sp.]|uniref:hypothetical protein n=1 Tax=Sphingomonas sp. TaxID=28214 RepID=UPI0025D34019|nr:hypothetical protein [Sphingomonas sp.]
MKSGNSNKPGLTAGLVAIKGTAAPAADMPTRAAAPAADRAAEPTAKPAGEGREELVPLNFRLPASFRREFKTYAARHDMKLNELLRRCFEAYRAENDD